MTIALYRNVIREAWRVTWKHRFLWFFGLFAALLGNGGEYEILFRNIDTVVNQDVVVVRARDLLQSGRLGVFWENFLNYFTTNSLPTILVSLIILAVFTFVLWLVIISQIGLVDSSFKLLGNQKATLEAGLKAGRRYFLPVFLLTLLSKFILYGLFIVIGTPLVLLFLSRISGWWNLLFLVSSFIILVPIAIVISFVLKYATAYVVVKREKMKIALLKGWKLFLKNWIVSIEMAFLILLFNILFGLALIVLAGLLSVPFLLLAMIFYLVGWQVGISVMLVLGILFLFVLIFVVGAWISTFQWVAWVGLFRRLIEEKAESKIVRLANQVFPS